VTSLRRQLTSLVMLSSVTVMMLSGLVMFAMPEYGPLGRGSRFLGLDRVQYRDLHLTFMVPFVVAGILHVIWNAKTIASYLRLGPSVPRLRALGLAIAVGLAVFLMAGTIMRLSPFQSWIGWSRSPSHEGGPGGMGFGPGGPGGPFGGGQGWGDPGWGGPWARAGTPSKTPGSSAGSMEYGSVAPD